MTLTGRKQEVLLLQEAIKSSRAELGIIYGRRRVGKSTLIKEFVTTKDDFYFEGLQQGSEAKQIKHFIDQLAKQTQQFKIAASSWADVFDYFTTFIKKGRHYVVFDELPWMASNRPDLVALLKYYWDNHWKNNPHLTLILCGSIAKFMVEHVIHSIALHNRKTFEIKLDPLSAVESKGFFRDLSPHEIIKYLTVFGGIPKYLEQIDWKKSFVQNMDTLCFNKHGFFINEFETIFKEQFKTTHNYENIIDKLSTGSFSKTDLAAKIKMPSGGGFSEYLDNLERTDFIKMFKSFSLEGHAGKTQRVYLWDEWLRFFFSYMRPNLHIIKQNSRPGLFEKLCLRNFETYCGLGFERLCLKNIGTILDQLGINLHNVKNFGPYFRQRPRLGKKQSTKPGVQIDLVIEQPGQWLTLVECKYSTNPVGTTVIDEFKNKVKTLGLPRLFSLQRILIAPGGVTQDVADQEYFHRILGSEAVLGTTT